MKNSHLFRFSLLACALVLAVGILGCGEEQSPVAVEQNDGPSYIVFGEKGLAKLAQAGSSLSTSGMFYPRQWGSITVSDWSWGTADTDGSIILKMATFSAEYGAISQPTNISMTAYWGTRVEDVAVVFTPSGLTFNPAAKLQIYLHGPLTDDMFDFAYHVDSNGNVVEKIPLEIYKERNEGTNSQWLITIKVPGFSKYSLGD